MHDAHAPLCQAPRRRTRDVGDRRGCRASTRFDSGQRDERGVALDQRHVEPSPPQQLEVPRGRRAAVAAADHDDAPLPARRRRRGRARFRRAPRPRIAPAIARRERSRGDRATVEAGSRCDVAMSASSARLACGRTRWRARRSRVGVALGASSGRQPVPALAPDLKRAQAPRQLIAGGHAPARPCHSERRRRRCRGRRRNRPRAPGRRASARRWRGNDADGWRRNVGLRVFGLSPSLARRLRRPAADADPSEQAEACTTMRSAQRVMARLRTR